MKLFISCLRQIVVMVILLIFVCRLADCYDPLDPNGNITITFDLYKWTDDGYMARVTIQNYYLYRHVDLPGWQLGWTWAKNEVIWSMRGAFARQQGNCSSFKDPIPHSCKRDPVIADLTPDAIPDNQSEHCCNGGALSAWAINPSMSFSSFEIIVGNLPGNSTGYMPMKLTLMAPGPGYTCGPLADYDPTVFSVIGGRREMQVFRTWKSTCTYSNFVANKAPTCCVSFSTFYSPTITPCPRCSCGCRPADKYAVSCISDSYPLSSMDSINLGNLVHCTDHMCPIRVHWHVRNNYKEQWRVKFTISNYNYGTNYSDWNALVQHPGFNNLTETYSFNSTMLPTVGFSDEVALFWGYEYYNNEILHADEKQLGSVTTEILMSKDPNSFTLRNGWAFPRRVYFNGENCEMPLPNDFPMLPNGASSQNSGVTASFLFLLYFI